jgi:hypothetical protein
VHKCRIVWEINQTMEDGRRFIVTKQYSLSLHEKATLHKDLKTWRGKSFTFDELAGFDVEKILGAPCQLVITQQEKDDVTYANVTAVLKADPKNKLQSTGTYIRVKDRDQKSSGGNGQSHDEDFGGDNDGDDGYASEIPF